MSDQLEDLYLKGFMAFNSKDYKGAKAYWEQVLSQDPNHAKARQGLEKLKAASGGKRKRSSKEVFQEIKKLYAAKKYEEALRLTRLLLKKHPDNQDLQGLRQKLEGRLKAGRKAPVADPQPSSDKRNTMFMAVSAEQSVEDTAAEDPAAEVEKLIQKGVSLYEIQDYENAIATWKQALVLDPHNRIAQDYVGNVSSLLEQDQAENEPEPDPPVAPAAEPQAEVDPGKPSKEKMLEVYNEAMGLYKDRKYHEALDKWNYILQYFPNHTETRQCVEKTNVLLEKEQAFVEKLVEVRGHIAAGRLTDAESMLTRLSIEAPDLDGLDQVQAELDAAREAAVSSADSVSSLDLDAADDMGGGKAADGRDDYSATDDEITSFFGPSSDEEGPRKVVSAAPPRKRKRDTVIPVFKIFAAVVFVAALGLGGYNGYNYIRKMNPDIENTQPNIVAEVDWNSEQQKAKDFYNFGSDFEDEGEFLFAAYAYQRVEDIGTPRLNKIAEDLALNPSLTLENEATAISDRVNKAKIQAREVTRKIRGDKVDTRAIELARTEIRREEYEEAADRLKAALQADVKNERARELLGQAHERLAFRKLNGGDLSGALSHFKRSAVLLPGYDLSRRHMEVIQRYFEGAIRKEDKDQWFFFFK